MQNIHRKKSIIRSCIYFCLSLLLYSDVYSQQSDSAGNGSIKKHSGFFLFFRNAITRSGKDPLFKPGALVLKNDIPFLAFEGKCIRHILVKEAGFERTLTDTAKEINETGKGIIQKLHRNTRELVIRHNLFVKEKTALNANIVADNERYLRSLDYIYDARIRVDTIGGEPDSVDLVVITKDFLSIIATFNDVRPGVFKAKAGDANLLGTAQKIQLTVLVEKKRDPHFGYEILYKKNSIAHTFINATLSYSKINPDLYDNTTDQHYWRAEIERPLVSQYMHIAGAISLAGGKTHNYYLKPDSLFYNYHYKTFDAWIGYNMGVRRSLFLRSASARQFIGIRYLRRKFERFPYQEAGKLHFSFNDQEAILAQFSFFRQYFYKTNYIFGFGITEDVPYGYNIAFTGGWYKQSYLQRPYAGVDANQYVITKWGDMLQYFLKAGSFLNKSRIQDAAVLVGASVFSRVLTWKNFKMRQYLRLSYTRQFNRAGLDPLDINNVFGLRYIYSDPANGKQRASLHTETIFFIKYKLLGFKFAPFVSGDIAHFLPEQKNDDNAGYYAGLGGGIRTRNENLIFGTIELRFMYFLRRSAQHSAFKLTLATNLRFRASFSYVNAPDIINVNSDRNNNIY